MSNRVQIPKGSRECRSRQIQPIGPWIEGGSSRGAHPAASSCPARLRFPDPLQLGRLHAAPEELLWRAKEVLELVASGELKVHIHAQLPLDEAALAHEMVETRKSIGKIILLPAEETVA